MDNKNDKEIKCLNLATGKHELVPRESLVFRPAVFGILIKNQKVLLVPTRHGYMLPGGAVEKGEALDGALKREVYEESGLSVEVGALLSISEDCWVSAYDKKTYHAINTTYLCKNIKGDISTDQFSEYEKEYYKKAEWVSLDEEEKIKSIYPNNVYQHIFKYINRN